MMPGEKTTRLRVLDRQAGRLDRSLERFRQIDGRFFWLRLSALLAGGLATFLAYLTGSFWTVLGAILLFTALFSVVVHFHRRLDRAGRRFRLARQLVSQQAARARLNWEAIPAGGLPGGSETLRNSSEERSPLDGGAHASSTHPFASDLNLYGERSLHQLLDTAFSQGGSRRLLGWLLAPSPKPGLIEERQGMVSELLALSGFRRRLALSSGLVSSGEEAERWDGEVVLRWLGLPPTWAGAARPAKPSNQATSGGPGPAHDPENGSPHGTPHALRPFLLYLGALALLNLLLFALFLLDLVPPFWILSFAVYFVSYAYKYRDLGETFDEAYDLSRSLERFRAVLVFLERYPYRPRSRLAELCAPFWSPSRRPSRRLRAILAIASAASLKMNPFIWLALNALVPWDMYFAHRLEGFKVELRSLLPAWLEAWYELEALVSLANFAYLNPEYYFPEVLEAPPTGGPVFTAQDLGHPLLPASVKVCNDFTLERLGQAAIVTGSNMSGKSTFLRTLGVNLALAYAGAPVNAAALRTVPFRLFTSIAVSDSLADGISYFYAEVRRLRALLDSLAAAEGPPVFYLIDEIFRGTNNRERQIGSRAFVRALVGGRGAGVISTHDLELVHLADELPGVINYHFREEVQDARLAFDYRLRPGPSPTTNALRIMAMEGLPVQVEG
jgi:hypothetical protein